MKKKYKISEIAKMFDITRTTLIHYDNCGLLSPSIRNEKNYRFYTLEDIKKLEFILALKESGLALSEIKGYLNEEIDKTSVQLLERQKEEIDKKIELLKRQSGVIQKKIKYLKRFNDLEIYEGIQLENYGGMKVVAESVGFGPLMNYSSAVNRLKSKLHEEGQLTSKYGICFDVNNKEHCRDYIKKYVFDYLSDNESGENTIEISSSNNLCCIHEGKHETIGETIGKIVKYACEKGYRIKGEAYYIPLFDYWESITEDFIGEVIVPIED